MDEPITDPEWVTVKYVKIGKYNRTTPAISVVLSLLRDLPDNTLVSITRSLLFPRMILFIPFNYFLFHTRNFKNIKDVRPIVSKHKLHMHSKGKMSSIKLYSELHDFSRALQPQFLFSATEFTWH
jgi:hypothetical protein